MPFTLGMRVSHPDQTSKAITEAIFPHLIDGDLLNLVHLSNGSRMLEGASPFHAGDVIPIEAKIASLINTEVGKAVKIIAVCRCVLNSSSPLLQDSGAPETENQ